MLEPPREETIESLRVHRLAGPESGESFAADVRRGLTADRNRLSPKYFYDALGSQLFEAICLLPEYYLTRAENEIFSRRAREIVEAATEGGTRVTLFELGSGSATKTRLIVEALLERQTSLLYVPVDISASALEQGARAMLREYPRLRVEAFASDYYTALPRLPEHFEDESRALVLFLGSNIGNFEPTEARSLLLALRRVLRAGDALLLGADLKKEPRVLDDAYDDPLGVTAAFNLNLLARINRELGADFDPRAFRHVGRYNEREGRVEMYVESRRAQVVRIAALDLEIHFAEGERIHTEYSYKYDLEEIGDLAARSGFALARTWLDERALFSSNLLVAEDR
ncbi:MAG TPA: L-histidine N(alpha)-methyltransferase [Pyrinomonadaceae bacterium]|nr:L-histidine N(alpha)-methyltransferase [Pyrinomonadaceae bacterium]